MKRKSADQLISLIDRLDFDNILKLVERYIEFVDNSDQRDPEIREIETRLRAEIRATDEFNVIEEVDSTSHFFDWIPNRRKHAGIILYYCKWLPLATKDQLKTRIYAMSALQSAQPTSKSLWDMV